MGKIYLSVIIPCYNESENLRRGVLKEVRNYLKTKKFTWEVIVSDDGSTDNSPKIIRKQIKNWKGFKLLKNPHGGKPSTLRYGLKSTKGDYTLFSDMDQSTPIRELDKLLPEVKKGSNIVIGSRGLNRGSFPLYRRLGAIVFASVRKAFVLSHIEDTQCGFKLFNTSILKKAFPKLEFFGREQRVGGWMVTSFDVELLHIIEKMGENISEVRVKWNDEDISGGKGGGISRYFRESREMLTQILRVKFNDVRGFYNNL